MTVETLRSFFLWCTIINYGIIILWFFLLLALGNQIFALHSKWFPIPQERFYFLWYQGMMFYKLAIMLFCLVPLIALYIIK